MLTAALAVAAVLAGTLAQSVSGIGFALVCGPLLVGALGPADGVRLSVLLSLVLNLLLLVRLRADAEPRSVLWLLVPSALATPPLALLARTLPERPAEVVAGAVVLVLVATLALGVRWAAATGRVGAVAAGIVAAGTNVVAGVSGPVVAVFAANADWHPRTARASLQLYFLGLNVVALPSLGLPRVGAALLLACLAAMGVGVAAGGPLSRRVTDDAARRTTLALAAAGALVVLVRALL